jgi:hypothetical protein
MPNVCEDAWIKTKKGIVPKLESRSMSIFLGIVNFLFFGIGTIVAGFISYDLSDVLIGLGQLFIPFVGWLWSIAWGVLMICDKRSGPIEETTSLL